MDTEAAIDALRHRIDELRALNPSFAALDREALAEAEVRDFEARHQVELPSSHLLWLRALGRRPIVPTLVGGQALALADCTRDPVYASFAGSLADEFPYRGQAPVEVAWDDAADDYADLQPLRGTLCLGSAGCDEIWLLALTGAERGTVWGFVPGTLFPTGMSAAQWSLERIERRLAEEHRALRAR
jgi:hypothetical protein